MRELSSTASDDAYVSFAYTPVEQTRRLMVVEVVLALGNMGVWGVDFLRLLA